MKLACGIVLSVFILFAVRTDAAENPPNILLILADDLGYGDVHCYNPDRGKIATPQIDQLAAQGMRFTDAHSSSGVCSPSRYTLLTGRYHWRTRLQAGIVRYLDFTCASRTSSRRARTRSGIHARSRFTWSGLRWPPWTWIPTIAPWRSAR